MVASIEEAAKSYRGPIFAVITKRHKNKEEAIIGFNNNYNETVFISSEEDFEFYYNIIRMYCDRFRQEPPIAFFASSVFNRKLMTKDEVASCGNIPPDAPEFWPGKWHSKNENLPDFFRRVWGPYIEKGLTLSDLRKRDIRLCRAIERYGSGSGEGEWPADLKIPTQRSSLAENVQIFEEHGPAALRPKDLVAVARRLQRTHTT